MGRSFVIFLCTLTSVLYALSFFLPASYIEVDGHRDTVYGYRAFLLGIGCFGSPLPGTSKVFLAWLANPMLWMGIISLASGRHRLACVLGVLSVILSGLLLSGNSADRNFVPIGYYLWIMSMAMFGLAACINLFACQRPSR